MGRRTKKFEKPWPREQGRSACVKKRELVTASSHLSRVCDAFSGAASFFAIFLLKL